MNTLSKANAIDDNRYAKKPLLPLGVFMETVMEIGMEMVIEMIIGMY
ncbi:hypothetical protein [Sodalis sp. dw_96]|nr:hypothetical protein [Sodalis sp. dw_96]